MNNLTCAFECWDQIENVVKSFEDFVIGMCLIQWDGSGTKWCFVLYFVHSTPFHWLANNEVSGSLSSSTDRMKHLEWLMRWDNQYTS